MLHVLPNSNILRYSSYKTFPTPRPQLHCSQTTSVCIFPLLCKTHTKQNAQCHITNASNEYLHLTSVTISSHKAYQNLPQRLQRHSFHLVPPLLQFQNPNHQETAQLKSLTLPYASAQSCWQHVTSLSFSPHSRTQFGWPRHDPTHHVANANKRIGQGAANCSRATITACRPLFSGTQIDGRNSGGGYALWKAYPAAYELIPFFSQCV